MANDVWKYINNITNGKAVIPRSDFNDKSYEPYFIMKWLSMDTSLCPILDYINSKHAHTKQGKYLHYLALYNEIPKKYRKINFVKASDNDSGFDKDDIKAVQVYFKVRKDLAVKYLTLMTEEQRKELTETLKRCDMIE